MEQEGAQVERETELEERQRHDAEIAAENKARQIRQGVIPDPDETESETEPQKSE